MNKESNRLIRIYGIPESILIDKEFTIIKKFVGPLNIEDLNEIKTITNSL